MGNITQKGYQYVFEAHQDKTDCLDNIVSILYQGYQNYKYYYQDE